MDNKRIIEDLLKSHGLKKTPIRLEMLQLFFKYDFALSASDLDTLMKSGHDRVTVYRALASFEEHGILHKASEDVQGIKYAMCSSSCPDEVHTDMHAHFTCDECHHTYCLEDVKVPEVKVSNNYAIDRVNYTLKGTCKQCKS
ncbi:hypothetical protein GCM10009122_60990 [Fulvivirga kasyanovii]|uniref:Transcriptional repressor n=1 Tax=Fulvivirga kasyanovii TaxID=396812 RepID=A0ABW9RVE8_9BACT|nr:transcriptional repressor [Fulvivirga kasyanovii]MTI26975.1 transcriptional repressor [Fulvivirga kasyanovii]